MTSLPLSRLLSLPLEGLRSALPQTARVSLATSRRAGLDALFDGPAGYVVILVLGDAARPDDADGLMVDCPVHTETLDVIVCHRLAPTATPAMGLCDHIAGAAPLLDIIDSVRDAMARIEMPEGITSGAWRYTGRQTATIDGVLVPAYVLTFEIDCTRAPTAADTAEINNNQTDQDQEGEVE